jgi:hypothetical protein
MRGATMMAPTRMLGADFLENEVAARLAEEIAVEGVAVVRAEVGVVEMRMQLLAVDDARLEAVAVISFVDGATSIVAIRALAAHWTRMTCLCNLLEAERFWATETTYMERVGHWKREDVDSGVADEGVEVDGGGSTLFPMLADFLERIHLLRNLFTCLNGCVDLPAHLEAKEKFYRTLNSHQCQNHLPEKRTGDRAMMATLACNDPCRCLSIIL